MQVGLVAILNFAGGAALQAVPPASLGWYLTSSFQCRCVTQIDFNVKVSSVMFVERMCTVYKLTFVYIAISMLLFRI